MIPPEVGVDHPAARRGWAVGCAPRRHGGVGEAIGDVGGDVEEDAVWSS